MNPACLLTLSLTLLASCGLPEARPRDESTMPPPLGEVPWLAPQTFFAGYVLDPFDFYLPGARLTLYARGGDGVERRVAETISDQWGVYELASMSTGPHRIAIESAAGLADDIVFTIDAPSDETLLTDIMLEPRATVVIQGTLVGSDGLPIAPADLDAWLATEGDALVGAGSRWCGQPVWHGWFEAAVNPANARFEIEVPAGFDGAVQCAAGEETVATTRWKDGDGLVELFVDAERVRSAIRAASTEVVGAVIPPADGIEQIFHLRLDVMQPFRRPSVVEGHVTIARPDGSLVSDERVLVPVDWDGGVTLVRVVPTGPIRFRADFRPLLYEDVELGIVANGGEILLR